MTLVASIAIWSVLYLLAYIYRWLANTRWRCRCGRHRRWYFRVRHEPTWVMALDVVLAVGLLCAGVALAPREASTMAGLIFNIVVLVWLVRRLWFHEKDKIKRAAKSAGRVVIDKHGRLRVARGAT